MCAAVAIAGVPPFSGFFSKDAVLLAAHHHAPWMYWLGVVTAGMTAFYVFRAMFMTFFGEYRGHAGDGHHHPHESPTVMLAPLMVLAALSLVGGWLFNVPRFLEPLFPLAEEGHDQTLVAISVAAGVLGIFFAWLMYVAKPGLADSLANGLKPLYTLVYNKYFVDEFYDAAVVKSVVTGSRTVLWRGADVGLIDRTVNGFGRFAQATGGVLRLLQSGNMRSYATWVLFGSVAVIVVLGIAGGIR